MTFIEKCRLILDGAKEGKLGNTIMPEDTNPGFKKTESEFQIAYFSLTMALNYQRDTYKLWEAALKTFNDPETKVVFDVQKVVKLPEEKVREYLLRHRLGLQPNKRVGSWRSISQTVAENWGSWEGLMKASEYDFLKLKEIVQGSHKKGFPYISGPKIFNYWSSVLERYGGVELCNQEFIEMAVDTHILKCSVKLGVISQEEAATLTRLEISERWRKALQGSGILPTEMHFVLWFWSRNGFLLEV